MSEMIIAEVHYKGADNTWFAIGFSSYGELKPADYCVLWIDWHRQIQLQVFTILISSLYISHFIFYVL